MMGSAAGTQDRLFCEFCLDDVVPTDHLLRKIDSVFDLKLASVRDAVVLQPLGPAFGLA